ncbi:hypothetical protein [Fibrella aquatica]|jgi:hypothetical protein|uniref:hypothetical protein n=1 Tax=Fibrella aquatica TaxID=3242487 RepID=UPI003521CF3B
MNRNNLLTILGLILALQIFFTALQYMGGYEAPPALTGGATAGIMSVYFARQRRKTK